MPFFEETCDMYTCVQGLREEEVLHSMHKSIAALTMQAGFPFQSTWLRQQKHRSDHNQKHYSLKAHT